MGALKPGLFFELSSEDLKQVAAARPSPHFIEMMASHETECRIVYDVVQRVGPLQASKETGYSIENINSMTRHYEHIRDVGILLNAWAKVSQRTKDVFIEEICDVARILGAEFDDYDNQSKDFDLGADIDRG